MKSTSVINKKRMAKKQGAMIQQATDKFPAHLMPNAPSDSTATTADVEINKLMRNSGIPRKRVK